MKEMRWDNLSVCEFGCLWEKVCVRACVSESLCVNVCWSEKEGVLCPICDSMKLLEWSSDKIFMMSKKNLSPCAEYKIGPRDVVALGEKKILNFLFKKFSLFSGDFTFYFLDIWVVKYLNFLLKPQHYRKYSSYWHILMNFLTFHLTRILSCVDLKSVVRTNNFE